MKVQCDGKQYWIEFDYRMVGIKWAQGLSEEREITTCLLRDASDYTPGGNVPVIAQGQVVRFYKDPPNREVARKAALTKALANLDDVLPAEGSFLHVRLSLAKARRKLFWTAYLNRKVAVGKAGA